MILDQNYINTKNQVIKAERRVLKELGFCVHVKHPHKVSSPDLIQSLHPTNGFIIGFKWRRVVSNNPFFCHPRSSSCTFKSWNVRRTKRWSRPPGKFLLGPPATPHPPVSHNPQQQPAPQICYQTWAVSRFSTCTRSTMTRPYSGNVTHQNI